MRVVAELITQDAEGAWGIAEAAGDIGGGLLLDKVSTEGFVLALHGELRRQEEVLVARCRYLIRSAGLHITMVLPKHTRVNMFGEGRWLLSTNHQYPGDELHIVAAGSMSGIQQGWLDSTKMIYLSVLYVSNTKKKEQATSTSFWSRSGTQRGSVEIEASPP